MRVTEALAIVFWTFAMESWFVKKKKKRVLNNESKIVYVPKHIPKLWITSLKVEGVVK